MTRPFRKIILLTLLPVLIHAQQEEIQFERLSLKDGLSQSTIRCIFQDSRGFMWFGSWDGLNRYDGYRFTVYNHDPENPNSLSAKSVLSIGEDESGRLWIGTTDGLNRFDRDTETFTHYRNDPGNPNSLSDNAVWSIYKDKSGVLWIGTMAGLNKLVPSEAEGLVPSTSPGQALSEAEGLVLTKSKRDTQDSPAKFIHYEKYPNSPNKVKAIFEDRSGGLWIGTWDGGLYKFDRETESFTRYRKDPHDSNSLSNYGVMDICEDKSGNLWIATHLGLNKLIFRDKRGSSPTFLHYRADSNNPNSLISDNILSICIDRSGMLWIGTEDSGLDKFDPQEEAFTHYKSEPGNPISLSHNGVYSIYEDRAGVLWIGTFGGGINKFYPKQKKFTHYKVEPGEPNSLSHNFVTSILEDKSGTLWIGTWGGGLNKLVRSDNEGSPPTYTHYKNEPGNPNSLSGNIVLAIYEDRSGMLWIGTWGEGFDKFNPRLKRGETGQFTHYKHDYTVPKRMSYNKVLSFYEDQASMLWIGTGGEGLVRFDPEKEVFSFYKNDSGNPNSLSDNNITFLYEDKSGVLWIGTGGGLNKLILSDNPRSPPEFIHYKYDSGDPNSLSHNVISSIYEDKSGVLWIGTDGGGLNKLVPGDNEGDPPAFSHYKKESSNPFSLNGNHVGVIYEDKLGALWIEAGGLNKFDRTRENIIHYGEKPGLLNKKIHGILEDESGNLWISSNKGFSKFNPESETFRNYDVRDGLQSNEFNGRAYFKSQKSGEMFFGGVNGFNSFYPDEIKDNPHSPQMVFTDFQIANKSVAIGAPSLPKSITETKEMVLSYRERVFSFEFAALHFADPGKNQYAYKMEGLDTDWNPIGTRRFTTFTNLSPGEYTFRVKGSNSDGVWNEEATSLKIIMTPPWWQTWWAYAFYVLFIATLLFGMIRFEISRARWKHQLKLEHLHAEKLAEIDQMKSRFFANISHEFRTPLTLILGPVEKLLTDTYDNKLKKQYRLMLRNGRRLLRLINQLLDLSKLDAGSMSLKARPENIVKLLKSTVLFFSSMAERKRIDLKFNAAQEEIIVYVDRDKLEKIVSNLLSNALKFTPEGGRVEVGLSIADWGMDHESKIDHPKSAIQITVSDTGSGIPSDRIDKIFDRFYQATEGSAGSIYDSHTREQDRPTKRALSGSVYPTGQAPLDRDRPTERALSDSAYPTGQEGTGIGLALTKELVELHHGEITVDSPPPPPDGKTEHGTTFTVWLPLGKGHLKPDEIIESPLDSSLPEVRGPIEVQPELDEIPQHERSAESIKEREVILVVDDNRDMREYMQDFLAETYHVLAASDGVEGFEKASKKLPDLIISDVMMPKMDGFEFCRRIKTDETTSHIPVILLTARAAGESKVEGLEVGADDYLTKPFEPRELLARVRNLIEQRRRLRERFSREITVQPKDIAITSMDEQFLQRAMAIVEKHLSEPEFTTETFAREIGLSRNQLHLKLQALTDQPTHGFIRLLRLKRAAQLLQQGAGTVSEIVYDVGFNNLSHFAKAFRQQFGQSPSQFVASHSQEDL